MMARGFTLVELIAVILIAGILAAIAAPRLLSGNAFAGRGYLDEAAGFLRYAQKLAVARHAHIHVLADANGLTLCANATAPCAGIHRIAGPDGETPYRAMVPAGVVFDGAGKSFSFDDLGRPSAARTFSISIVGDERLTLTVEAETGYVH